MRIDFRNGAHLAGDRRCDAGEPVLKAEIRAVGAMVANSSHSWAASAPSDRIQNLDPLHFQPSRVTRANAGRQQASLRWHANGPGHHAGGVPIAVNESNNMSVESGARLTVAKRSRLLPP